MKAPFPWFGGKRVVSDVVWSRLGADVANYVEPFFGSGAVLLNRPGWTDEQSWIETVNDRDGFIANFWRAVQHDPAQVARWADWPVNECVPAGTMIATPDGEIAVENVRPGMTVLGYRDGTVVPTKVIAAKRSEGRRFVQVGPLTLTDNHPVWTEERGYLEAGQLADGLHVRSLRLPICENELDMLQCGREQQSSVGDIHTIRSAHQSSALCRHNISRAGALQGTSLPRGDWRQDAPRLLDSFSDCRWHKAAIRDNRKRRWRRMAGSRTPLDRPLPVVDETHEFDRWGRRRSRLYAHTGSATEMVKDAGGGAICSWACIGHEGQETYTRRIGENTVRQQRAEDARQYATEVVRLATAESDPSRTTRQDECRQQSNQTNGRISTTRTGGKCQSQQACSLYRNGRSVFLYQGRGIGYRREQRSDSVRFAPRYAVQRVHSATPLAVYNFETDTHNYFANRILVHNCDLHARHVWLRERRETLTRRLEGDPDYYDAKIAGWWVWGICCWIGGGWCDPETTGPWGVVEDDDGCRQLVHLSDAGQGVTRQLVHLRNAGQGVTRQRVHLGDAGRGVTRQRVHLGDAGRGVTRKLVHLSDAGQGVTRQRVHLGNAGQGEAGDGEQGLVAWMQALSSRMARVRVASGDWSRVCGPTPTIKLGTTAVFLDPPYSLNERDVGLYASESEHADVAAECREWALANGDNPQLRIALCGYDTEHAMPETWERYAWQAHGGYANLGSGNGQFNKKRETIWFSPHCLKPATAMQTLFDFGAIELAIDDESENEDA